MYLVIGLLCLKKMHLDEEIMLNMDFGKDIILVDVVKHEHANMDSFPLRYKKHFSVNQEIKLINMTAMFARFDHRV